MVEGYAKAFESLHNSDVKSSVSSKSLFDERMLDICYESYDPTAPPFETQQLGTKFRVATLCPNF